MGCGWFGAWVIFILQTSSLFFPVSKPFLLRSSLMVLLALSFFAPPLTVGVCSPPPPLRAWKRARDHDRSRKFSFCRRLIPSLPSTDVFAAMVPSTAPRSQSDSPRTLVESPVITFQQAIQRLQVCRRFLSFSAFLVQ